MKPDTPQLYPHNNNMNHETDTHNLTKPMHIDEVKELRIKVINLEGQLYTANEQIKKSLVENVEIREAIGDGGQRTHQELLTLCRNASLWKTWRQKYKDLDMGVRCEYCDPGGTIWECCKDRNKRTDEEINKVRAQLKRAIEIAELTLVGYPPSPDQDRLQAELTTLKEQIK